MRLIGQRVGAGAGGGNSSNGSSNGYGGGNNTNNNTSNGNGGGRRRGRGCGANAANANAASTSTTSSSASNVTPMSPAQETAGVVTAFLSNESCVADNWLCDSGASSSMSSIRSAFSSLKSDRRPIRLADGKVIYSDGLGSIRFLTDCDYVITIHNVLFVPFLAVSLFASNKFAREHCGMHSEVTEYPKRKWINCQTGAMEFTTTI